LCNPQLLESFETRYACYYHAAIHLAGYIWSLGSDPGTTLGSARFFHPRRPQKFHFWSRFVALFTSYSSGKELKNYYFVETEGSPSGSNEFMAILQATAGFLLVGTMRSLLEDAYDVRQEETNTASALHFCVEGPLRSKDLMNVLPTRVPLELEDTSTFHACGSNFADWRLRRQQIATMLLSAGIDAALESEWEYPVVRADYPSETDMSRAGAWLTPPGAALYYRRPESIPSSLGPWRTIFRQ
jgi:hypothetical protein